MMSKHIFQKEPVLSIATCLAIISAFFVPPGREYLGYIDFRTSCNPVSLMTVMAGLRGQGVFDRLGHASYLIPHHFAANSCSRWPMLLQQYADNKRCIAADIRAIYVCRSE